MKKIPVMVLKNKTNTERFLASSMEVGDWSDENLDVTMDNIQNAYCIIRKDLTVPMVEDFETHKTYHTKHKEHMIKQFGEDAFISMDFEGICEQYEPVNIEISQTQYEYAKQLMEES